MSHELGRYTNLKELGQGGFAIVYRAQDTELDRLVALKELRPALVRDSNWAMRFKREARTIAQLNHPRIVTIYDILTAEERLFIVMRLVDGPSLDKALTEQGPIPWADSLTIIRAVADALDYAHRRDILHRDLKPANILIDRERGAQLSDFGLAKLISDGGSSLTDAGAIAGTPKYIAPEVWEGQGSSKQSDIYALGCILYELLTGDKLFDGGSPPAIMMAHFSPLTLPAEWPASIPPGIGEVLEKALARNPQDRYQSATQMAQALSLLKQEAQPGEHSTPLVVQPPTPKARHNLPAQATPFIGREGELTELKRLLVDSETRLVTILGPGGMGKTRLMLEIAGQVIDNYANGVWLAELAPLTDPNLIAERVMAALNIQEQAERKALDTLVEYLRRKELLLLIDNVEHLIRECARFAEHLLAQCPKLSILITGREALFINGESTIQIASLTLPADNLTPTAIAQTEAVQLFLERAKAVRPDFEITPQNAPSIVEIVQRLDGIPLALELAAARLRMMPVEQIAARLNDRFRLLTGGRRTALPRQQTLQALIDWSWNLLEEKERILLRRLSVFSGGWTMEAASEVTADGQLDVYDVFDALEQLVNKSLVMVEHLPEGEARYGMLESIRQYARDRLFEAEEGETFRNRHAEYIVGFSEEAALHLNQPEMMSWVNRLRRELDNFRAVVAWTLDEQPELTLRLVKILYVQNGFWLSPSEAYEWLEGVISRTRPAFSAGASQIVPAHFIQALLGLGVMTGLLGKEAEATETFQETVTLARAYGEQRLLTYAIGLSFLPRGFNIPLEKVSELEEAILICRQHNYQVELAYCVTLMGGIYLMQGNLEKATSYLDEGVQLTTALGSPRDLARAQQIQAFVMEFKGDLEGALKLSIKNSHQFEAIGDRQRFNMARSEIAHILRRQGKLEEATAYYRETLLAWQAHGSQVALAHQLECFAFLAIAGEEYERAAKLLGAAKETRQHLNAPTNNPFEIADMTQAMEQLSHALDEAEQEKLMAEGGLMSLDEAVAFALAGVDG